MTEFYRYHYKEEYAQVKGIVFSYSVIPDAIKVVHDRIEEFIAAYQYKVISGEYKNTSLQDTEEIISISLWTRAKSSLLKRKVVKRKPVKAKLKPVKKDVVKKFEDGLYSPPDSEQMKFSDD